MNKLSTILILLVLSCVSAFSQQLPLFSNYIFDPYLYNPAYIANSGFTEINFIHRRQWVDIQDAPVISGINAQIPLNGKLAIGVNAINDESVLLDRISGGVTVGYKVPLSSHHKIAFGLSMGVIYNSLDLDGVETVTDPALASAADRSTSLDGQFGIMYNWKNLSLGFSLPRLFVSDPNSEESFSEIEFAELRNQIFIASYKVELSPLINLQPAVQYRFTQDEQDFFEAAALIGYKDLVKVGGFYRQDSGPGFLFQLTANDLVSISYGHEFATNQDLSFAGATHEFQLKLRLGKKKPPLVVKDRTNNVNDPIAQTTPDQEKENQPVLDSIRVEETTLSNKKSLEEAGLQPEEPSEVSPPKDRTEKNVSEKDIALENNVKDVEVNKEPVEVQEMTSGYYLVVGSFHTEEYAQSLYKEVIKLHPNSEIGYDESTDFYFVYIEKVSETEGSLEAIQSIRETTSFKDAWFKKIE